ncbi:MAG: hypothetical protein LBE12_12170 [Planctomycetaceae bacterium]|nr:hypothetical protein [Planctomycetaceae bacterium]
MMPSRANQIYRVEKIGEMKHVARFRLFADNYQFYINAPNLITNPLEVFGAVISMTPADFERGWVKTNSTITLFTVEDCNDHRIDVFVGEEYDGHGNAQRVLVHSLNLSRGILLIFCGTDAFETKIQVPAGCYSVYTRVFNIGKGTDNFIEDDQQFLARDDIERYEIVLVPGSTEKEGVIFGTENFHDIKISTQENEENEENEGNDLD